MNKRNIIIVAMLAVILMGSVVLSAGNTTFIIHNVYSITQHDPIEISYFTNVSTEELYDLESSTLTITISYTAQPNTHCQARVIQGDRIWGSIYLTPAGSNFDFELELPGPYEKRNPESDY